MVTSFVSLKVSPENISELKKFLNSKYFLNKGEKRNKSYSPYWKEHSSKMIVKLKDDKVSLEGESGLYIPQGNFFIKIFKLIKRPLHLLRKIIFLKNKRPMKLLKPQKAFDKIMNNKEYKNNSLAKFRYDHFIHKKSDSRILSSSKEIKNHYAKWNQSVINDSLIFQYYYRNLLLPYVSKSKFFLEIGAGSGNLANLLTYEYLPKNYLIVDLPETIVNSYNFLIKTFPNFKYFLPNKINNSKDLQNIFSLRAKGITKFIFLTPWQINFVPNNIFDLSINVASFQEMKGSEIKRYFKFIQKTTKDRGLFFCVNRLEKIPYSDSFKELISPNRFYEYPWHNSNIRIIDQISELQQLTSFNHSGIRLERVIKTKR